MKKTKLGIFLLVAPFVLMSLIFFVVGIIKKTEVDNFLKTAEKVEARICDIDTYTVRGRKGRNKTSHKVYVDYIVDGIIYDHILLDGYNSSMSVGKTIVIYYNPEFPKQVKSGDTSGSTIMLVASAITMVISILISGALIKKRLERKKLMTEGTAYTGRIINVRESVSYGKKKRYFYQADCEVINPITQERFVVSSEKVNDDIRILVGMPIVVYMNNGDPPKHFADVESAMIRYEETRAGGYQLKR